MHDLCSVLTWKWIHMHLGCQHVRCSLFPIVIYSKSPHGMIADGKKWSRWNLLFTLCVDSVSLYWRFCPATRNRTVHIFLHAVCVHYWVTYETIVDLDRSEWIEWPDGWYVCTAFWTDFRMDKQDSQNVFSKTEAPKQINVSFFLYRYLVV